MSSNPANRKADNTISVVIKSFTYRVYKQATYIQIIAVQASLNSDFLFIAV